MDNKPIDMDELRRTAFEKRIRAEANSKAMDMLIDFMHALAPDDMKDIISVPKLVNHIDDETRKVLFLISEAPSPDDKAIAADACVLLSRIDEALEAFIEQHTGGDA